jgi:hypothetical protein
MIKIFRKLLVEIKDIYLYYLTDPFNSPAFL